MHSDVRAARHPHPFRLSIQIRILHSPGRVCIRFNISATANLMRIFRRPSTVSVGEGVTERRAEQRADLRKIIMDLFPNFPWQLACGRRVPYDCDASRPPCIPLCRHAGDCVAVRSPRSPLGGGHGIIPPPIGRRPEFPKCSIRTAHGGTWRGGCYPRRLHPSFRAGSESVNVSNMPMFRH
ncbi:hypothetical protein BDZ89DRAFT_655053 [Hymenopellis radicata]|nr:hypothetical protein BDZ89DRAFT_655053 [Hymenopellis radicata]